MSPKTFISYSTEDKALAQRLKGDLSRAGCDPWQFDLSAIPGTDAWDAILERIEKGDFLVVILSQKATASRVVQEEIAHAHYCSINSAERRPRIIPLITEEKVDVPRQIIRAVRLPFRQEHYNNDFERLLNALGVEQSPFSSTTELDVTFSSGREFDIEREAGLYASSLIRDQDDVARAFETLSANARATAGGRWRMPSPQTVTWEVNTWREKRQPQFIRKSEVKVLVILPLHCGFSSGYESTERVAMEIEAFDELKYDHVGEDDLILHSDTLRLRFGGFRDLSSSPLKLE
jgi:hypothetical protein